MIQQDKFKNTDVLIDGEQTSTIGMDIDKESTAHLMMVLSSNLYQNSIGSIVREYTSNAVDANIDAKSENPVIVKIDQKLSEFSVEDFGPGLDHDDFVNIISKYGKSTKRDKQDQLGFYGLGCKSAFSYTNSFYYICRKDGVERKYLLYKSEIGFNIDMLFEKQTTEKNGTKVVIPIKPYEQHLFIKEIRSQLAYFDNVFFDITSVDLNKDFKIYVDGDIQRSTIYNRDEMHICLGRVNYPIDWSAIGLSRINLPIGIKFELDSGIFPTPNRESIIWNTNTKKLVVDRIKKVASHIVKKYNEKVKTFKNIVEGYESITRHSKYLNYLDKDMDITYLSSFENFQEPTIPNCVINPPSFYTRYLSDLLAEYNLVAEKYNGNINTKRIYNRISSSLVNNKKGAILSEDVIIKGYLREYLKTLPYDFYIKKNGTKIKFSDIKPSWKDGEKAEFQLVRDDIINQCFKDLTDIQNSKEFEDFKKNNKKKVTRAYVSKKIVKHKDQVTIGFSYKVDGMERYAFGKEPIFLDEIYKKNKLIVLVDKELEEKFELANNYKAFCILSPIVFAKVPGIRDYEKIKKHKSHNLVMLSEFEKTKTFKRVATAYKIQDILKTYESLTGEVIEPLHNALKPLKSTYDRLSEYRTKHHTYISDEAFVKGIITVAEKNNLFDPEILPEMQKMEKNLEDYDFIKYIRKPNRWDSNEEYKNVIYSLMLMKKLRYDKMKDLKIVKA